MISEQWKKDFAGTLKSAKYELESYYLTDENIAEALLEGMVTRLEGYLGNCLNVSDGSCMTWWKHEECLTLQGILWDITGDEKYMRGSMHAERAWMRK